MKNSAFVDFLRAETESLWGQGLYKTERAISSPQQAWIEVDGQRVLNLCANNYLGLSNHPALVEAARDALTKYGFGLSSVRFICGTQTIHQELETKLSEFLGTEETILYSSCFDANGGLFETLLGPDDAVISDALNHASIIDGIRLSKAKRFRYANGDMADLEKQLQAAAGCRFRLIATDGVFSMDGVTADLSAICNLADQYDAAVMVDDSHAVGFVGETGRGTHEACGVIERVDIMTGTFGKALGGASGGFTSGRKEIIDWLRQRSRPYLFSNSVAPSIVAATLAVLDMLRENDTLRMRLRENSRFFRASMETLGFDLVPGDHPIIPVMLGDAVLAERMSAALLEEGIYVIGFSYPVVPQGKARLRTQMSAAHSRDDLQQAVAAFEKIGRRLGVI